VLGHTVKIITLDLDLVSTATEPLRSMLLNNKVDPDLQEVQLLSTSSLLKLKSMEWLLLRPLLESIPILQPRLNRSTIPPFLVSKVVEEESIVTLR